MVKSWKPFLIGANPLDRGVIMSKLSRFITSSWDPSYPAAVSTIDFALWDLVGKILNQPVYQLLGGKAVEKLRFEYYVRPDASHTGMAKAVAQAEELVAGSVTCLGIKSTVFGGQEQSMEKDIATVKELTKRFGDKA
jgi:L-alanine-DL-glutamate epimerase-like enolase superfamily enzyme